MAGSSGASAGVTGNAEIGARVMVFKESYCVNLF
jgi:hypothetical protein